MSDTTEVECRLSSASMISTQSTAAITESTRQAFTDLSVKDYALGDGKEVNIQYGSNKGQPERKSLMISGKLRPKLNNNISKGSKESSKSLTTTNIPKKRSLEVDTTDFATLNTEYEAARSRAREWNFMCMANLANQIRCRLWEFSPIWKM